MRAIILAAGRGIRLQQATDQQQPKCLLSFGGMTLLERHLRLLRNAGVDEVVLALGWRHELVEAELDRLAWQPRPEIVLNDRFELGSVLTVHTAAAAMTPPASNSLRRVMRIAIVSRLLLRFACPLSPAKAGTAMPKHSRHGEGRSETPQEKAGHEARLETSAIDRGEAGHFRVLR